MTAEVLRRMSVWKEKSARKKIKAAWKQTFPGSDFRPFRSRRASPLAEPQVRLPGRATTQFCRCTPIATISWRCILSVLQSHRHTAMMCSFHDARQQTGAHLHHLSALPLLCTHHSRSKRFLLGVVSGDIKEYPNDWRRCEKVGVAVAMPW